MTVEFVATVAASLGQFLDARTTQVAVNENGRRERNPASRFIIERFGFVWYYAFKAVLIPLTGFALHSTGTLFFIAAIGAVCAAWNKFSDGQWCNR